MALSEDMKRSIDTYENDISTLEDYVTAVRTIPGMYIGPIGTMGYVNMIREIFQNGIDQIVDPTSPANHVSLSIDLRTLEVTVTDNGKGLPFTSMIRILTTPHTSKNYQKQLFQYSSGRHGQGCKVVNALSTYLIAQSYRYDGKAMEFRTKEGHPTSKEPKPINNKEKKQGTRITFAPCAVMGDIDLTNWKIVYRLVKHITSLTPIGSTVDFEVIEANDKRFTEHIINKDGIITDLIEKVKHPLIKPIILGDDNGTNRVQVAFCFDAGGEDGPDEVENVTSFCNFCPTVKGTHVDGVVDGITTWFRNYMNNIYMATTKSKLKIIAADIKNGLNVMISAAHLEPNFTGQAKEILSNDDMVPFCRTTMMSGLDEWSKQNPQDLAKMCKFFKEIAEIRTKNDNSKAKIANKFIANPISGLPRKYIRPLGKKDIELIIVEGDSAKGTVEEGRDSMRQGIFPIRGKIINAFKCSKQKFFSNEEVQGIHSIMFGNTPYKRGLDPKDCRVSKIIFMADADVDLEIM